MKIEEIREPPVMPPATLRVTFTSEEMVILKVRGGRYTSPYGFADVEVGKLFYKILEAVRKL